MRNPWTRKNPAMSMILSAANTWMGAARGYTLAAKRQAAASAKLSAPAKKKRRKS